MTEYPLCQAVALFFRDAISLDLHNTGSKLLCHFSNRETGSEKWGDLSKAT